MIADSVHLLASKLSQRIHPGAPPIPPVPATPVATAVSVAAVPVAAPPTVTGLYGSSLKK